jgi:ribonucleoside-diphosphate reductase subunit M2
MDDNHKPTETVKVDKSETKPSVAPTIKPDEIDEPILQENPQRFVLFPIKYHEVCTKKKRRDPLTFDPGRVPTRKVAPHYGTSML